MLDELENQLCDRYSRTEELNISRMSNNNLVARKLACDMLGCHVRSRRLWILIIYRT